MKKTLHITLSLVSAILLIIISAAFIPEQQQAIKVIANERGAPGTLSMPELKAILRGERQRWSDGTKVSIAFMKTNTAVGSETAEKILDMSGDQLNKLWLALVFQGKAKAPNFFSNPADLENYVSQTPGAIGVVDGQLVSKAKTIIVDGKKSL
jgi:ABC-type phosphate transport system substrate-binding protein